MNLQQRHYLAAMNGGSKIVAALKDENPSAAKEVVENTLMGRAAEQIQENVGPAVDKSPISEGWKGNEDFQKGLQAGYLYASNCYKEAMMRREGMRKLHASRGRHDAPATPGAMATRRRGRGAVNASRDHSFSRARSQGMPGPGPVDMGQPGGRPFYGGPSRINASRHPMPGGMNPVSRIDLGRGRDPFAGRRPRR